MYSTSSFLTKLHGPKSCNKRTQFLASYIHVTSTNDKKNGNSVSSVSKHRASHVIRHQFALNNSHRWAHYGKATWRGKTIRSIGKQTKGRKKHELHVKNECQIAKRRYAPGSSSRHEKWECSSLIRMNSSEFSLYHIRILHACTQFSPRCISRFFRIETATESLACIRIREPYLLLYRPAQYYYYYTANKTTRK